MVVLIILCGFKVNFIYFLNFHSHPRKRSNLSCKMIEFEDNESFQRR